MSLSSLCRELSNEWHYGVTSVCVCVCVCVRMVMLLTGKPQNRGTQTAAEKHEKLNNVIALVLAIASV